MESVLALAAAFTMTMNVSVYAPGAEKISGGFFAANGVRLEDGHAACGSAHPFGTTFEVIGSVADELRKRNIPTKVTCVDRGGWIGNMNLDIALVSGVSNRDRLKRAYDFGRRYGAVIVKRPDVPKTSAGE